jgi:hypothetical protein
MYQVCKVIFYGTKADYFLCSDWMECNKIFSILIAYDVHYAVMVLARITHLQPPFVLSMSNRTCGSVASMVQSYRVHEHTLPGGHDSFRSLLATVPCCSATFHIQAFGTDTHNRACGEAWRVLSLGSLPWGASSSALVARLLEDAGSVLYSNQPFPSCAPLSALLQLPFTVCT